MDKLAIAYSTISLCAIGGLLLSRAFAEPSALSMVLSFAWGSSIGIFSFMIARGVKND